MHDVTAGDVERVCAIVGSRSRAGNEEKPSVVMTGSYPAIEPYVHDMLAVGDGNLVYWQACGNPHGKPAVVLHGGPGSGCSECHRRLFDPTAYRLLLFHQRGCGRGTPHAGGIDTDLTSNATPKRGTRPTTPASPEN